MAIPFHLKALSKEPIANTTGWRAFGIALDGGATLATPRVIEIPLIGWYYDDEIEEAMMPLLAKHYDEECAIIVLSNHQGEMGEHQLVFVLAVNDPFQKLSYLVGSTYLLRDIREYMLNDFIGMKGVSELLDRDGSAGQE